MKVKAVAGLTIWASRTTLESENKNKICFSFVQESRPLTKFMPYKLQKYTKGKNNCFLLLQKT
jgi:hypothetical protein